MNIVVFGLSITSAWGNGHATLLRGLFRELHRSGHEIHFFERDVPYYAAHRDAVDLSFATIHLYTEWIDILPQAKALLADADVGMVTSYCPDGVAASALVCESKCPRTIFYDMDAPVTLSRLSQGERVPYLPPEGLRDFDLVLSYTGGAALRGIRHRLGARSVATLYGWVDPAIYYPVERSSKFESDLSYLGTYSQDRHFSLTQLLISPAIRLNSHRFVVGGAMYPDIKSWPSNIRHFEHVSPPEHCGFYCSSPLTLNVTRGTMAAMGYCPSGRLFEAAACGTAVLSDDWLGLDSFFTPGQEILLASSTEEAIDAITSDPGFLAQIGMRAQQRALECHTAAIRARRLIDLIESPLDEVGDEPVHLGQRAAAYEEA